MSDKEKDIALTMDSRVLVKQVLSVLPQMGNQINVINIQSVHQNGTEIGREMLCFDLEFEKFFGMLPHPRLRSLVDFCYQMALKQFQGNAFSASRYLGISQKAIYNFLNMRKSDQVLEEITEDG